MELQCKCLDNLVKLIRQKYNCDLLKYLKDDEIIKYIEYIENKDICSLNKIVEELFLSRL